MPWPRGSSRGTRLVEQGYGAPGLKAATVLSANSQAAMMFPWYEGGYSKGLWSFTFAGDDSGTAMTVGCFVEALDSDGQVLAPKPLTVGGTPGTVADYLITPTTFENDSTSVGMMGWTCSWDDGPLPGNIAFWYGNGSTPTESQSMNLNPWWTSAAFLRFTVANASSSTLLVAQNSLLLGSK